MFQRGASHDASVGERLGREKQSHVNTALWIASGLLALVMVAAGGTKLAVPREKLLDKMKWAASWSDGRFKLLGLAEVLGGVGVIVPSATGIVPVLTPIAALCLVVLMVGAVKTHIDLNEAPMAGGPAFFAALGVFVALGRFGVI